MRSKRGLVVQIGAHKYAIANETNINDVNYYLAVQVKEAEDGITNKGLFFKESLKDDKPYLQQVTDADTLMLLQVVFTQIQLEELKALVGKK